MPTPNSPFFGEPPCSAMIAAPVIQSLCDFYFVAPEYLGTAAGVEMQTVSGSLFADGRVRPSPDP